MRRGGWGPAGKAGQFPRARQAGRTGKPAVKDGLLLPRRGNFLPVLERGNTERLWNLQGGY